MWPHAALVASVAECDNASGRKQSQKTNMKPLSGIDGAFLSLETPATPMHVGSLHLFETPPRYRGDFRDAIKRMISSRLQPAPIFRRRLAQMPLRFANPVWIDEGVDLDYHIRR